MAELRQLEFFLLRYAPDAVKDECVNLGLVMVEPGLNGTGFADVRFTRDWRRVRCADPDVDIEVLEAMERDIRTQLQGTRDRETLLRRMDDSFSNVIQISTARACLAEDPATEIEMLARSYLESPRRSATNEFAGRRRIVREMRDAFEQAGVWGLLEHEIAAAPYTHIGDPLKIDCGYRPNGVIKMFHGISLKAGVDAAKALAFSYPQIAEGILRDRKAGTSLTAVIEDDLDRGDDAIGFALVMLEKSRIEVAVVAEMPLIAERVRLELRA